MKPKDRENTSFITHRGTYCYNIMPFSLKNTGATYQRMVNKIFEEKIGKNMKVYVDDMVTKSKKASNHIVDLSQTFDQLEKHQMRLNPTECVFGVHEGMFLGYIVNQRGIEANPGKIKALLEMQSPSCKKDVQRLTGRVTTLNRFVSRATYRCLTFFKILKRVLSGKKNVRKLFWN